MDPLYFCRHHAWLRRSSLSCSTVLKFPMPSSSEPKRVVRVIKTTTKTKRNGSEEETISPLIPLVLLSILLLLFAAYHSIIPSISHYYNRSRSFPPIQVWDDVLNDDTCHTLHQVSFQFLASKEHALLFHWPLQQTPPNNYIEQVIDCILHELYSSNHEFMVEYWVKQQWHHTLAHADIDETLLERDKKLRHPIKGHVLYLDKGRHVNGPTVVFSNITRGGELMYTPEQEMLIVPFVKGRLLQFDGNLLHAVPRPANLWIRPLDSHEPMHHHEPPTDYGRSVVLFNLWEEPAPVGLEVTNHSTSHGKETVVVTSDANDSLLCNPKSEWQNAPIASDWEGSLWDFIFQNRMKFQLPLMGNEIRRGTKEFTLQLKASSLVEQALLDSAVDARPKRVYLETQSSAMEATRQEL